MNLCIENAEMKVMMMSNDNSDDGEGRWEEKRRCRRSQSYADESSWRHGEFPQGVSKTGRPEFRLCFGRPDGESEGVEVAEGEKKKGKGSIVSNGALTLGGYDERLHKSPMNKEVLLADLAPFL